jgi:hypothetical protein
LIRRVPGAYTIDASEARSGARPAVTALATEASAEAAAVTAGRAPERASDASIV